MFDRYSETDYKFVTLDAVTDKIIIGHRTAKGGFVIDAQVSRTIDA
ncbi:hypothetical protein LP420_40390 [Massilia sp. B-10]|nr:hypothetical protein LP420_40390 [Massilia sp. B-10]